MRQTGHSVTIFTSFVLLSWASVGVTAAYSQTVDEVSILKQVNISRMNVLSANYSGITHIEGDRYAVVDDKGYGCGVSFLDIKMNKSNGKITDVVQSFMPDMEHRTDELRDGEGIAYCNETGTLFVSGEEDQKILEYDMNGKPTGRQLAVPLSMGKSNIYGNRGFESLTYNHATKLFWTTTESALKSDCLSFSANTPCEKNILRLQSFGLDRMPAKQYAYRMETPRMRKKNIRNFVCGVSDMLALDDGRLIMMEREMCVTKTFLGSYCTIRLFMVNPMESEEIEEGTDVNTLSEDRLLKKSLLCKFTTYLKLGNMGFANYEGMCLGPRLDDGRQTLILINDSQKGAGNMFKHLKEYLKVIVVRL
ncbi:MAG: esterase-like activity of phytase family protein [Prevotellaceae bacterium]|nr:esterase-like activity of phytase family protein [Prevotellaceae bacterium]